MKLLRYWILQGILSFSITLHAQTSDSLQKESTSEFSAADSLSIFNLIDSLLALDDLNRSQLALRMGYNSNVLSAGRTLGIDNFGLAPGISYFHHTGLFADVTGYYSKDFIPSYYLTVVSVGYLKELLRNLSVLISYDRYFYHVNSSYLPYTNTLSVTPSFDWKFINASVSYSYYFGDQTAHRVMPGVGATFEKRSVWKLDRIAISPTFYFLYGNEIVTTFEYVQPNTIREAIQNRRLYGTRYRIEVKDKNVFGIMNYVVTVPLTMQKKKWTMSVSYTYNVPKALPGEPFTLSESTFISGSLMYVIDFHTNKKPL